MKLRAALCALAVAVSASPAWAGRDLFVVDLASEPASLDPHVQWDPDSYAVYRNIFDNLLTRDASGKIVAQVATAWHYQSATAVDVRYPQ